MATVKGFIKSYFQCLECTKHFVRHASKDDAAHVQTKKDAVLWMWKTHNIVRARLGEGAGEGGGAGHATVPDRACRPVGSPQVNRRLSVEADESGHGDPESPHIQWPSAEQCPPCHKVLGPDGEGGWDEDAVYAYMRLYYDGKHTAAEVLGRRLRAEGKRNPRASWPAAFGITGGVCAAVYLALRRSGAYGLRKNSSRLL